MKRLAVVAGVFGLLIGGFASTASADPTRTEEFSFSFEDINPCTGELQIVTLNFVDSIHEHANNFLFTTRRSGTTSDGSVMQSGTESFVDNGRVVRGHFMDNWINPTTGARFQVHGVFVFNINRMEPKVERFSLRCVGGETLLPPE